MGRRDSIRSKVFRRVSRLLYLRMRYWGVELGESSTNHPCTYCSRSWDQLHVLLEWGCIVHLLGF